MYIHLSYMFLMFFVSTYCLLIIVLCSDCINYESLSIYYLIISAVGICNCVFAAAADEIFSP